MIIYGHCYEKSLVCKVRCFLRKLEKMFGQQPTPNFTKDLMESL